MSEAMCVLPKQNASDIFVATKMLNCNTLKNAERMGIICLFVLLLAGSPGAVVIVPPMVYFASISIAGFLANALISLGALAAVAGVANWKLFNSSASGIISALFGIASKLFIGLLSMAVALVAFFPVSVQQIILSASSVLVVSAILLFLRDYRLFRASQKAMKLQLLKSIAIFALFFAIVFAPSAYFAIEYRAISTQQTALPVSASGMPGSEAGVAPFAPGQGGAASQAIAPLAQAPAEQGEAAKQVAQAPADYKGLENGKAAGQQGDLVLWFMPQSSEDCIVEFGGAKEIFKPKRECKLQPSVFSEPQLCPVSIRVPRQCQKDVRILAAGSCSDSILLQCKNSQLEEMSQ